MLMSLSDGRHLDLINPRPDRDLRLDDTAHALAQTNQFTGRTKRPYSVAEHSILVHDILHIEFPLVVASAPFLPYYGLMHDAHEAVVGDVSSPVKGTLGELGIDWAARFDTPWRLRFQERFGYDSKHPTVKKADHIALASARAVLMHDQSDWPVLRGIVPPAWATECIAANGSRSWDSWRDEWLLMARDYAKQFGVAP